MNDTTAVAYICNNLGGIASGELVILTRDLLMWCMERNIHIAAVHLPARCIEYNSRRRIHAGQDRLEIEPQSINNLYRPLDKDLFASRLSNQC